MLENEAAFHEINVSIAGRLTTERITATGRRKTFCGGGGGLCITPAGQTIAAFWEKPISHLGILLAPDFVEQTAVENRFSPKFDLYDNANEKDPLIQYIGLSLLNEYNNETVEGRLYAESLIQSGNCRSRRSEPISFRPRFPQINRNDPAKLPDAAAHRTCQSAARCRRFADCRGQSQNRLQKSKPFHHAVSKIYEPHAENVARIENSIIL